MILKKLKEIIFSCNLYITSHFGSHSECLKIWQWLSRKKGGDSAHFLSNIFYWNYFSGNSWMWQHLKKSKINCSISQQVLKANQIPEEKDTLKCYVQFFHVLKTKEENIAGICSKQSPDYNFTSFGPSKITLSTKHLTVGKIEEGKNNFKYSNLSVRAYCWNLTLEPLGINFI